MKLTFETPIIVGALCSQRRQIPKEFFRHFDKLKTQFAFLPFQVEKKYLKNTLECMKLMDIHSLLICGPHRKDILPHLKTVDTAARKAGIVDVIVRKKRGSFVGKKVGLFCHAAVGLLTAGKNPK